MLTDLHLGQYIQGTSRLHKLDPRTKLWSLIVVTMSLFILDQWSQILGIGLILLVLILISQVPLSWQFSSVKAVWPLLLFTLILNSVTIAGRELLEIGPIVVTEQGVQMGLLMVFRIALVILATGLFTFTTSPIQLTDGLEKLLKPLKKIGVPSGELALMMTIALRFIPTIVEEGQKLIQAVQARGGKLNTSGLVRKANALAPLLIPLFLGVFRRAEELALAMEARCYQPRGTRSNFRQLELKNLDYLILGCTSVIFLVLIATQVY